MSPTIFSLRQKYSLAREKI